MEETSISVWADMTVLSAMSLLSICIKSNNLGSLVRMDPEMHIYNIVLGQIAPISPLIMPPSRPNVGARVTRPRHTIDTDMKVQIMTLQGPDVSASLCPSVLDASAPIDPPPSPRLSPSAQLGRNHASTALSFAIRPREFASLFAGTIVSFILRAREAAHNEMINDLLIETRAK